MSTASDSALALGVAVPDCEVVLELLAGYLATDLGHAELERLRFHRDPAELDDLHRRLAQAGLWLQRRGGFRFSALEADPRPLLAAALPGAGLGIAELLQVLRFLDAAAALRESLVVPTEVGIRGGDAVSAWPDLAALGAAIPEAVELRRALHAALLPNGDVDDQASPELARLRRHRARQRQAIETSLAQHLRRLGGEGVLQDELVTVRNERFVLPVRAGERRRAPGVVHGASSSGQTVFVEPLETIELNNEHIRLIEAEQAEVRRILVALTARLGAEAAAIAHGAEACGVLELESAKARFAADYGARAVEFSSGPEPVLELRQARHPVLVHALRASGGEVVPLSLALGAQRVLVVSGPNTGGKTVVLKTVAIAAWMAQCGLPVCAERALLPIFDALWADVGDVQSLEESLSTFSSHLLHIRGILAAAGPASLVVFDELGTATNAAEGAALAVEIAEFLAQRRAWTLISTHHDALKAWAGARAGVANGSVAVDPETLAPSYRFRFGAPGLSAGLDMAERLGLPAAVIAGARARLSRDERDSSAYLQRLQQNLAQAEERLAAVQQREAALEERELAVEARERALASHDRAYLQRQIAALRADLDRRLAAFTATAERNWHRAMEDLAAGITAAQKRKVALAAARMKRETAEAFQSEVGSVLGGGVAEAAAAPPAPRPGDRVRLRSFNQPARVLRVLADGGLEVEAGPLRLQVSAADVTAVIEVASGAATESGPRPSARAAASEAPAVAELNLVGLRMEEAVEKLEKFLDQVILTEAVQVRIVHGAGFGVLRQAVADTLRAHPQVASFAHPPQNQGGQGVTLAVMK